MLIPLVNELGLPIHEKSSRKAGYAIGMSWPVRLHSRALPRESMETSERSNTRGLHLEFVCLRKVRQACDANAKAIRCLEFPSSLQPVYTRTVSCIRLCSSASRGAARMSATKTDRKRAADHRGRPSSTLIEVVCELLQWSGKVDIVVRRTLSLPSMPLEPSVRAGVDGHRNALDGRHESPAD